MSGSLAEQTEMVLGWSLYCRSAAGAAAVRVGSTVAGM